MSRWLPLKATPSPAFFDFAASLAPGRTSSGAEARSARRYGCSSDRNRCNAREKPFSEMPNLMG